MEKYVKIGFFPFSVQIKESQVKIKDELIGQNNFKMAVFNFYELIKIKHFSVIWLSILKEI